MNIPDIAYLLKFKANVMSVVFLRYLITFRRKKNPIREI